MTYLVTGGCGFIGSNVVARLLAESQRVLVVDNLSRAGSQQNLDWLRSLGSFQFIHGDVRSALDVELWMTQQRPRVVFHLAGQVAMTTSMASPRLDFETNALGSLNLLEAARRCCPKVTLVYASSNKVYGALQGLALVESAQRYSSPSHPRGVDESMSLDFQTPYGCSKGCADQYMLDFARVYGLKTVVFRHSTVYGGRQFATFDQGWVGWFCQQALAVQAEPNRAPFTIAGTGKQVRDLLYVDDAVSAYLAAAQQIEQARGQAFNIGGGIDNSSSLLELFELLQTELGVQLSFQETDWRHSDQRFFVADNGKAERLLGWSPQTTKQEGIRRVLGWMSQPASLTLP